MADIKRAPEMNRRQTVLDDVLALVGNSPVSDVQSHMWWVRKRPDGWTLADHLRHPTVYCSTAEEKTRAVEAAKWIKGSGTPNQTDGS